MTVIVKLGMEEAFRMMEMAEEASGLLARAEEVFSLLSSVIEGGDYVAHVGVPAIADLASRAIADFQERQGDSLVNLSRRIRDSLPPGEGTAQ